MSITGRLLARRPRVEESLTRVFPPRLGLPRINPRLLFPDFDAQPVTLAELPLGPWSSPLVDLVILTKFAACLRPRRVLEVGSFRGFTARMLAAHTPETTRLVTVDRDPRHGSAYRGTPLAARIERRVGVVGPEVFAGDGPGSYQLIFLDAEHAYAEVRHDTEVLLPLLAPDGILVWHDYAPWGHYSGRNGVPTLVHELAARIPVAAVSGTWMAVHSPAWAGGEGAALLERARRAVAAPRAGEDPWEIENLRG